MVFQLEANPTLKDTVTTMLAQNDFTLDVQKQPLYLQFVASLHTSKGDRDLTSAQQILQCLAVACNSVIPTCVVDFAAASYEAAIVNGGPCPEDLGAIFDTTTHARLVAMSRTTFTVHATGGFIATLPEATCKADSISALKSFMAGCSCTTAHPCCTVCSL